MPRPRLPEAWVGCASLVLHVEEDAGEEAGELPSLVGAQLPREPDSARAQQLDRAEGTLVSVDAETDGRGGSPPRIRGLHARRLEGSLAEGEGSLGVTAR